MIKTLAIMLFALTLTVFAQHKFTEFRGVNLGDNISELVEELGAPGAIEKQTKTYSQYIWGNITIANEARNGILTAHVVDGTIKHIRILFTARPHELVDLFNAISAIYLNDHGFGNNNQLEETGNEVRIRWQQGDDSAISLFHKGEWQTMLFSFRLNQGSGIVACRIRTQGKSSLIIDYQDDRINGGIGRESL